MPAPSKQNNFDLLRIFAATEVMVGHAMFLLGVPPPAWWQLFEKLPGVPIFFVISGFLISASLERSRSLPAYAEARALRIFPALWCCVTLTVLAFTLAGVDFAHWQALPWFVAQFAGLIYTPGFLREVGFGSYNGSLWTIPVELQFYLLIPLLYWALYGSANRPGRQWQRLAVALAGFTALALALNLLFPGPSMAEVRQEPLAAKLVRYSFLPHFYLFVAGALMQRLHVQDWRCVRGKALWWLLAYLTVRYTVPLSGATYAPMMLLLAVCTLSAAYTLPTLAGRLLRHTDISYGVYVYHGLLLNLFLMLGPKAQGVHVLALCAATYLTAWVSWTLVEKPCLALKGRLLPRSSGAAAAQRG